MREYREADQHTKIITANIHITRIQTNGFVKKETISSRERNAMGKRDLIVFYSEKRSCRNDEWFSMISPFEDCHTSDEIKNKNSRNERMLPTGYNILSKVRVVFKWRKPG